METRRLEVLLQLSRLGSMRAVADALGLTTSSVSQQIAVLSRESGTPLIEPDGRRVRLTPAGRRLATHAQTILAAVEAARSDLDPGADPAGTVRVAGFATAIRHSLLPVVAELAARQARVHLLIGEHEPSDALAQLDADQVDLAITYDYNLAPSNPGARVVAPLWTAAWGLGVPAPVDRDGPHLPGGHRDVHDDARAAPTYERSADTVARYRDLAWVVNSRNTADERVVRTLAGLAGFPPRIEHQVDSLELVEELIVAGLGVGLLPIDRTPAPGVRVLPFAAPEVILRAYAVARPGRASWPALGLVLELLGAAPLPEEPPWGRRWS